jgi:flagellar L-ring protein precursor FlgH
MKTSSIVLACVAVISAAPAWAQAPAPTDSVPPDSAASASAAPVSNFARAAWITDRMPLRVGDLLTIVVDEQTAASEHVSKVATGNRAQNNQLRATINDSNTNANIVHGVDNSSRDVGDANRTGDFTAVLTVRITAIEPNGIATIEGSKTVNVDGRLQQISLKGAIRPEDVSTSNLVASNRIADAVITYKGKKIGPRTGIIGKFLGLLWP